MIMFHCYFFRTQKSLSSFTLNNAKIMGITSEYLLMRPNVHMWTQFSFYQHKFYRSFSKYFICVEIQSSYRSHSYDKFFGILLLFSFLHFAHLFKLAFYSSRCSTKKKLWNGLRAYILISMSIIKKNFCFSFSTFQWIFTSFFWLVHC